MVHKGLTSIGRQSPANRAQSRANALADRPSNARATVTRRTRVASTHRECDPAPGADQPAGSGMAANRGRHDPDAGWCRMRGTQGNQKRVENNLRGEALVRFGPLPQHDFVGHGFAIQGVTSVQRECFGFRARLSDPEGDRSARRKSAAAAKAGGLPSAEQASFWSCFVALIWSPQAASMVSPPLSPSARRLAGRWR